MLNLDTGLCFDCFLEQVISEIKEDIGKNGLEATRTSWKEDKSQFERIIREVKREDPVLGRKFEEAFQEIENLLYPDRKKNKGGSGWIWILVIVIVVVVGIVGYFWYQKPKRKK